MRENYVENPVNGILSVPQNIVMDLNDVTEQNSFKKEEENKGSVCTDFVDHMHKILGTSLNNLMEHPCKHFEVCDIINSS